MAKGAQVLVVLSVSAVPVTAGVAILRYRLYDLDLIINRKVIYGSVSVMPAIAFGVADPRVMATGGPGEIIGTTALVASIGDSAAAWLDRGDHELRGVPGTWRLYTLSGPISG